MNALIISFFAASCAAFSNWIFRKAFRENDSSSNGSSYLTMFYLCSLLVTLFMNPDIRTFPFNPVMFSLGGIVGVLNIGVMRFTAEALKRGPAGLTFAFQNASCIFPGLFLFMLFGANFGFSCSLSQLIGMALVLIGLFLGSRMENQQKQNMSGSRKWLKFALICFTTQVLAMTCIQGRTILFDGQKLSEFLSKFAVSIDDDAWFMPGQFGVAFALQLLMFFKTKQKVNVRELRYGFFAGIANFGSTCLLLLATRIAQPFETAMIFPCFAVATILLCNSWAWKLYGEKFQFAPNALCASGILLSFI